MTKNQLDAIEVLNGCYQSVEADGTLNRWQTFGAKLALRNAIRHVSRPDRLIYPKTRKGTKRNPITRKG